MSATLDKELKAALARSRRLIWGIIAGLGLLLALSLSATGYLLHQSATETARIQAAVAHNAATITQLCHTGNEFRAQQVVLWQHLVAISKPPPGETVQARTARLRTDAAFLAYVQHVFAPRNCTSPNRTETP